MATNDSDHVPETPTHPSGTEEKWRRLLEEQEKSGLKQSQFCRQRGIAGHQFSYWKRKILKEQKKATTSAERHSPPAKPVAPGLVAVRVRPGGEDRARVLDSTVFELKVNGTNHVLRIPEHFDPDRLACLIQVLQTSC